VTDRVRIVDGPAFQFLQCTNPGCRFRFPAPVYRGGPAQYCPRCGQPVEPTARPHPGRALTYPTVVPTGPPLVGLLDNIRSVYNVGAMFRTADGAGLAHLYLCGITATPDHPSLAKTALGAEMAVPWSYRPNGLDLARNLCDHGYQLWAIENGAQAESLFDRSGQITAQPLALIVGNELAGVDPGILAVCHRILALPMSGQKRSLNVEVAFGIAAYIIRFSARPERIEGDPFHSTES
jgi:23S rRNA (guanosine2251-2'-O)-methyltransferase